jgi:hypothetical protein
MLAKLLAILGCTLTVVCGYLFISHPQIANFALGAAMAGIAIVVVGLVIDM